MGRVAALLFVAAAPPACGGGSASPSAATACGDSAAARCSRIQACSTIRLAELYGDLATCEARVTANCVTSLAAPASGNTPAHVAACAAVIPGWDCTDFLSGANPPTECVQVTGSVANGGACYALGQCQSGFCAFSTSACGTCANAPAAGDPSTPTAQCGTGLQRAGDGTCVAPARQDAACGTSQSCAPGLRCVSAVCTPVGASAAAGQPCAVTNGQVVACIDGTCAGGTSPVCVAHAADGAACDLTVGPYCRAPALCVGAICQLAICP